MKKTIASIAAAGFLFTATPVHSQAILDIGAIHDENVKRWVSEVQAPPDLPSLEELAGNEREQVMEENWENRDDAYARTLKKVTEVVGQIQEGEHNPLRKCSEVKKELIKGYWDFFWANEFRDALYALPNERSEVLIEKIAHKYPLQKAMVQYVKHFAFDPTDTIPNDYLWQLRPKKAGASGMKQLYDRAHERVKDFFGVKTTLGADYRAKLGAAREKDRMFITGLYAIEKRLDKCLDACPPEELQTLLFDYGILAQARQEYVRTVFDKGVEKLTSKELQLK
jgi:hypothetical protein